MVGRQRSRAISRLGAGGALAPGDVTTRVADVREKLNQISSKIMLTILKIGLMFILLRALKIYLCERPF